jgi:toxin ParE1/3/4
MDYVFHDHARQELLGSAAFYESKVPGLGDRFIDEIDRCISLLLNAPEIGSPMTDKLRRYVVDDSFPFAIVYAVLGDVLFVVSVAHHSRRPNYWKNRLMRTHR